MTMSRENATCNDRVSNGHAEEIAIAAPTEQFPENLSGKRTAWLENLESGSNAHRRGYRDAGSSQVPRTDGGHRVARPS